MKNLLLLIAIAISLNSFGQIPPNIPSNGLIGWWPFNGNANDESGNINNGTVNGAVLTYDRTSTNNSAYHFNGTSDFISLANVPQTSLDSITISCWMRATSLNQFGMALCYGLDPGSAPADGIQFGLTGNISPCSSLTGNEVSFIHSGVACASTGYLFLDTLTWHHVILEHKNSITKIFVDANLVHTQTLVTISPVTQFTIGSATSTRFFEGDIDDIGVWNRTLTSCEIQAMYDDSNVGVDTQIACDSYTWINSITYSNSNNIAIHTIVNGATNGCDSIVQLNLTINTVDSSVSQSGFILTANESGATYQWLNCPAMSQISGATNQSYTAPANGNYAVIVTNNGCSDTSTCYTVTTLGIIESDFGDKLLLYPNPTGGNFSVDLGKTYNAITITISDLNGKLIHSKTYYESQLLNLKLEEPAGVYLLMIESGDKKAVIKLLKE